MNESEWLACDDPGLMLGCVRISVVGRKVRLFAVACCRAMSGWLLDGRSREAVEVAEGFADGVRTDRELQRAYGRARRAAGVVGGSPAQAVCSVTLTRFTDFEARRVAEQAASAFGDAGSAEWRDARSRQAGLLRDVFGNPFRPVSFDPSWRTPTTGALARRMYDERDFAAMPLLADALQEAGCEVRDVLAHCRGGGEHVLGCWVVDLVLGKE